MPRLTVTASTVVNNTDEAVASAAIVTQAASGYLPLNGITWETTPGYVAVLTKMDQNALNDKRTVGDAVIVTAANVAALTTALATKAAAGYEFVGNTIYANSKFAQLCVLWQQ